MKKTALYLAILLPVIAARAQQPAPEILGIRLGMRFEQAHARLARIASFRSETEGQQVWVLNKDNDKHYQYAIVGFDRDRTVRYVTVLARPGGQPLNYSDVGNLSRATRSGAVGNLRYTWTAVDKKHHLEYVAIAKGSDAHRLSRYSIKRLGQQEDQEDKD